MNEFSVSVLISESKSWHDNYVCETSLLIRLDDNTGVAYDNAWPTFLDLIVGRARQKHKSERSYR